MYVACCINKHRIPCFYICYLPFCTDWKVQMHLVQQKPQKHIQLFLRTYNNRWNHFNELCIDYVEHPYTNLLQWILKKWSCMDERLIAFTPVDIASALHLISYKYSSLLFQGIYSVYIILLDCLVRTFV